jgi:hypothetical protein
MKSRNRVTHALMRRLPRSPHPRKRPGSMPAECPASGAVPESETPSGRYRLGIDRKRTWGTGAEAAPHELARANSSAHKNRQYILPGIDTLDGHLDQILGFQGHAA